VYYIIAGSATSFVEMVWNALELSSESQLTICPHFGAQNFDKFLSKNRC